MSTISGTTINHGITLSNSGSYASPLTITSDGAVSAPAGSASFAAIYGTISSAYILNQGGVLNSNPGYSFGIKLTSGGTVKNFGSISAYSAVKITNGIGYVSNSGTILGSNIVAGTTADDSVYLAAGGTIINTGLMGGIDLFGGGRISISSSGVVVARGLLLSGDVAIQNDGSITANAGVFGAAINNGSGATTLVNTGLISASGTSDIGVSLSSNSTVINSGSISGASGTAIAFGGTGGSFLTLENGYSLGGVVTIAGTSNTLELLGAAGAVTVGLNSHGLINFNTVLFGASSGNNEVLTITNNSGTVPVTISGLSSSNDIIDLTGIGTDGHVTSTDTVNHLVTVSGVGGTVVLQLDAGDSTNFTTVSDSSTGTDLSVACYCRDTMILTPRGEVPVEELIIGDKLVTVSGEARAIRWIGRRGYSGRFIAGNRDVLPVCIRTDAIMHGVPARDLWVSPEHSLYIDTVLVQARHLINGITVVQAESIDEVEYFHIELESHDVIYADGAPAETFVDCDNRLMFANGREYDRLYPNDERSRWHFCAPRLEWGSPQLAAIRTWMFERACASVAAVSDDPELQLVVDGNPVMPTEVCGSAYRFTVSSATGPVWLESRTHVAAECNASFDTRRLGVPVEQVILASGGSSLTIWHWNPMLRDGFYTSEGTHRWTSGRARIPDQMLSAFSGPLTIEVRLATGISSAAAA